MKILVASHSYIVDLNCEKLRVLANLEPNIEVTIVVPKCWRPGGVMKNTIEPVRRDEGNFRVIPVSNFSQNNQGLLTFGADLISLLRDFKPDIIQVEQGAKSLAYAQMITLNKLLGLRAKNCFFTWWNLPYQLKFPISLLEAYNLHHTHGAMVGNQAGIQVLRDRGYGGPIRVLPQLGVDHELFQAQVQPELRASLGIMPQEFVFGFVGRFIPEKGLITLVNAIAKLKKNNWKLLLLGRGELKETILKTAEELGIADKLIWVESVPHADVSRYISAMDALVLPSETTYTVKTLTAVGWQEQFGHVLIEAMACCVPVVGSDSGEIPNVIADAGLVFPEGDVAALHDRLAQLMDNPDLAKSIAQAGYERAMIHYTNHALAKEALAFYRSLSNAMPSL